MELMQRLTSLHQLPSDDEERLTPRRGTPARQRSGWRCLCSSEGPDRGSPVVARERPEIVGGALAWHGPDRFTLVVCFTDEASAREGEAKNAESPGADIDQLMHDVSCDELRDPWTLPL